MAGAEAVRRPPLVVGIGGTLRPGSSSERTMRRSLLAAEQIGVRTVAFPAADLVLPMYDPAIANRDVQAQRLITAIAEADGIIISTPGYHGGISGLIKNALDYVEDLREADRPYFDGRAIGCIACAHGPQATMSTLISLRSVVHALRGWPTPLGVAVDSSKPIWKQDGELSVGTVASQLDAVGRQVATFALDHFSRG